MPTSVDESTPQTRSMLARRLGTGVAAIAALVTLALIGPQLASRFMRQLALHDLQCGAITAAQAHLTWASWLAPRDGAIDLAHAFCYRHLQRAEEWDAAVQAAAKKGVEEARVQHEVRLQLAQAGVLTEGPENELLNASTQSLTEYDIPAMLVYGYTATHRYSQAEQLLSAWDASFPNNPHVRFMKAKYWLARGATKRGRTLLNDAVALQPQHELARLTLAESYEQFGELKRAAEQYVQLARLAPESVLPRLGIARVLRKLGYNDHAAAILSRYDRGPSSPDVAAELGRLALYRGRYESARQYFERADRESTEAIDLLASAQALAGDTRVAQQFFAASSEERNRFVHAGDIQNRLTIHPDDQAAATILEQLELPPGSRPIGDRLRNHGDREPASLTAGTLLYRQHCAACHGVDGDGQGPAARHLYPRPRNLRDHPSRLVSRVGGEPTWEDRAHVIREGIHGTSMPGFPDLSEEEVAALIELLQRFREAGLREAYVAGEQELETDQEAIAEFIRQRTAAGELVEVPAATGGTDAAVARGERLFRQQGCVSCHRQDGVGVAGTTWFDEWGLPQHPRDLAHEPLKGGDDFRSLYLRIAAGMPGTPHPASGTLGENEISDLVHYCQSLAQPPARVTTNYERYLTARSSAYLAWLRE